MHTRTLGYVSAHHLQTTPSEALLDVCWSNALNVKSSCQSPCLIFFIYVQKIGWWFGGYILPKEMYLCMFPIPSRQPNQQNDPFCFFFSSTEVSENTLKGSQTLFWRSNTHYIAPTQGASKGLLSPMASFQEFLMLFTMWPCYPGHSYWDWRWLPYLGLAIHVRAVTGLRGVSQTRAGQAELPEELACATGGGSRLTASRWSRAHT